MTILDGTERLDYDVFWARASASGPRTLMVLGRALWLPASWARSA
jgi:hypothetical protein